MAGAWLLSNSYAAAVTRVALIIVTALLAWGAVAFGAVYPWAYQPLIAAATLAGALGLLAGRRHSGGPSRELLLALAAVAAAILLQLLPVPPSLVRALSPSTLDAVRQLDFPFGAGLVTTHPLSIQPAQTWTALLLLASFTLLLAGTACLLSRRGAWLDAWHVVSLFPLAGTGLNTYGTAMRLFQRYDLDQLYVQAHNDYLQLAAEGGLLVVVPVVFCVFFFVRDVRRRFREDGRSSAYWIRAGAVAGIVAIALQEVVEFSLQMPGNATLFAVMCAIAVHKAPERTAADVSPWVPGR